MNMKCAKIIRLYNNDNDHDDDDDDNNLSIDSFKGVYEFKWYLVIC